MYGPLSISLAPQIKAASSSFYNALKPLANFYAKAAGYRTFGLKYDDLLMEERKDVQKALDRLGEKEAYDRAFRIRVAIQQSMLHRDLPKEQWLKPEDDVRYLTPIVNEVVAENNERAFYDTAAVVKK